MSNDPFDGQRGMSGPEFLSGGDQPPPNVAGDAKAKVTPPAIALIVVGALSTLSALYGCVSSALLDPDMAQMDAAIEDMTAELGPDSLPVQFMEQLAAAMQGPWILVLNVIALFIGIIILLGAVKMLGLKSRTLAMTAAVFAMLPLGNCCCVGLPVGIWALIVLMNADVKQAFS